MAMKAAIEFTAETRSATGTGSARDARRKGLVPVVVYAKGKPNAHVSVNANQLSQAYFKGGFMNKIVSLKADGKETFAIARDIQLNPVSDKIEHADFLQVDTKSVVKVRVPLHFINTDKSVGIKRGGVLNIVSHDVELLSPVTSIPSVLEIDVLELNIGNSIHINDLKLPEGVTPANKGRDVTIASLTGRAKDEEENPAAAAAASAVPASTAKAPAAGAAAAAKPAAKK